MTLEPHPRVHPDEALREDPLRVIRPDQPLLFLWWNSPEEYRDLAPELIAKLAGRGVCVTYGAGSDLLTAAQGRAGDAPLIRDDGDMLESYPGPVIAVVPTSASTVPQPVVARLDMKMPTYVVGPAGLPAPDKPQWAWRHLADASMNIRTALEIL
jgi:hypothetical protein